MKLRLATWNINSVRLRIEQLARLATEAAPDIICLQETKVTDDLFPHEAIAAMGYDHRLVRGMKSYNGVAILSRVALTEGATRDWCDRQDCRHISALLPGGAELHNFYVPAGGDIPDIDANDKFAHKLDFMTAMAAWFTAPGAAGRPMILVGDLNVAPLENDVWSHKQLLKVVSHTPVEVAHLDAVQDSRQWVDAVRHFVAPAEPLYSWWSYRAKDWEAADRGRRLDHIWVTPDLTDGLCDAQVLRPVRGWQRPSDHAPVILDLDLQ